VLRGDPNIDQANTATIQILEAQSELEKDRKLFHNLIIYKEG
jgi:hypothetical protein